jgi:predicted transcriptional regulator
MIKEILKIVRDGGPLSKSTIADKMGIQESTLENIFSLLSSKGYLKKIDDNIEMSSACVGCSKGNNCLQKTSSGSVYIITEKGKNYL